MEQPKYPVFGDLILDSRQYVAGKWYLVTTKNSAGICQYGEDNIFRTGDGGVFPAGRGSRVHEVLDDPSLAAVGCEEPTTLSPQDAELILKAENNEPAPALLSAVEIHNLTIEAGKTIVGNPRRR